MERSDFNYREARRECMGFGLRIGLCWSVSFLCSMYGTRAALAGNVGLLIGLFSVYYTVRLIRGYGARTMRGVSFMQAWWMAFLTHIFATMCTAVVQYAYFRYLDGGAFAGQMELAMQVPAYKRLTEGISEEDMEQMMTTLASPSQLAYRMLLFDMALGFVLSVPAALFGRIRPKRDKNS